MANVRIIWIDSPAPATGFKIFRDDVEIADVLAGVQEYIDTAAPDDATSKYEIQAHDGAGDETTQEVQGINMDYITTASAPVEPVVTNLVVEDAAPNNVVITFSKAVVGTNLGFTIGGTTSSAFSSISGSGVTWTGVLGNEVAFGETVTLSYDSGSGDFEDTVDNIALESFSNSPVTNNVAAPVAPDAPTSLVVGTETDTTIPLTWTLSASGAMTNYRVYIGGVLQQTFGNVSSGTLTGLTAETTYNNITVRAWDGVLESADSNAVSGTTEAAPTSSVPIVEQFTFEMDTTPADQIVLTKPAGTINNGDLLMMIVGNEDDSNTISGNPVAGWTKAFEHGDSGQDVKVMMYWRIADGTEGANETVTFATGINALFGWYLHISGAHATAPIGIEGVVEKAASTIITTPSITTTINNSLVFSLFGFDSAHGSISVTSGVGWPTDFPANQYIWSGGGTGDIEGGFLTKDMVTAGATNDVVYTSTIVNGHVGLQFEILSLTP